MISKTEGLNPYEPGWRLLFPIWWSYQLRYDVATDYFVGGMWRVGVGISIHRIGAAGHFHGFAIRVNWGWLPPKHPVSQRNCGG